MDTGSQRRGKRENVAFFVSVQAPTIAAASNCIRYVVKDFFQQSLKFEC